MFHFDHRYSLTEGSILLTDIDLLNVSIYPRYRLTGGFIFITAIDLLKISF